MIERFLYCFYFRVFNVRLRGASATVGVAQPETTTTPKRAEIDGGVRRREVIEARAFFFFAGTHKCDVDRAVQV
jgi:hypothetical protein